jgi:hypothetical protein
MHPSQLKVIQAAQCPYVVVCYQSFYDNGVISIILEYMDGGSMADLLKKVKTIPEPYLSAICKQVGSMTLFFSLPLIFLLTEPLTGANSLILCVMI